LKATKPEWQIGQSATKELQAWPGRVYVYVGKGRIMCFAIRTEKYLTPTPPWEVEL
jgi:hypothetical protein